MLRRRWRYGDEVPLPAQADRQVERIDKGFLDAEPRRFSYGDRGSALSSTVLKLRSSTDRLNPKKTVTFSQSPSVDTRIVMGDDDYDASRAFLYARSIPSWPSSVHSCTDAVLRSLVHHGRAVPDDGQLSKQRVPAPPSTDSHRMAAQADLSWSDRRGRAAHMLIVQTLAAEDFVDLLIERCILQEATAVVKETVCSLVWDHVEVRPLTDLIQRLVDELIYETVLSELTTDSSPALQRHHDLVQEEVSALAADLFTDALQAEYFLALLSAHGDECAEARSMRRDFGESFLDSLILDVLLREVIHITHA